MIELSRVQVIRRGSPKAKIPGKAVECVFLDIPLSLHSPKECFFPLFFCKFHKRATTGSVASFRRRAVFVPRARRAVGRRRSYRERDTSRANCSISSSKTGRSFVITTTRCGISDIGRVRNTVKNIYITFRIVSLSRIESNTIIFVSFKRSRKKSAKGFENLWF